MGFCVGGDRGFGAWFGALMAGVSVAGDGPKDVSDRFIVPEGLEVTLWAESPQFFNPTNIDVDARGRIWVTEAVNYRRFNNARETQLFHPEGDRVVILEDTDGDGACDSSKVFVQDADLTSPLGIAVLGPPEGPREVYVSSSPSIFKYVDEDGDDVPERRETFLDGFGGFDHDHGVHAIVVGPDGNFYFIAGNAGPHFITEKPWFAEVEGLEAYKDVGKSTLRVSSFASGQAGAPDFVSDDGRLWVGGIALRIRRDGYYLRPLAHNFRNCYEIAIDSFGDLWQNDNDDDGNQGCRIAWVMEGGNYGYASADGTRSWQLDRRPGQSILTAHWHQDDPGVMPLGANTGAGGPTGIVVYESDALGPEFEQALFSCDAGRSTVWWCVPELKGAGFELSPKPFLAPAPGSADAGWFRPSDVAVGLDGALFIADWSDPMVGGHGMRDDHGSGRILRIARRGSDPGEAKLRVPELDTFEGALEALSAAAIHVRSEGQSALLRRHPLLLTELGDRFAAAPPVEKARLIALCPTICFGRYSKIGFYGASISVALEIVGRALEDENPRIRIAALRAVDPSGFPFIPEETIDWKVLAADPSAAVRREALVQLRRFVRQLPGAAPPGESDDAGAEKDAGDSVYRSRLLEFAAGIDGEDRVLLEAFGNACAGLEERLWPDLVARFGNTPTKWSKQFEAIAWRLHPKAAVDAFLARALSSELPLSQRRRSVDALAFIRDGRAADAMVEIALRASGEVQALAAFWIGLLDRHEWKEFAPGRRLGLGARDPEKALWRSGLMSAGVAELDVDVTGARSLWLVVTDGGDGYSHDWADWIEPVLSGPEGEARLTDLPWTIAHAGWGDVHVDRNCGGGPLAIDDAPAAFGVGTHASSEIGWMLPAGRFTRLRAKVGPDDGGTRQQDARTSIEFQVFAEPADGADATGAGASGGGPSDEELARLRAARERLLAADTPPAERVRLAGELALDPDGGAWLVELAARGALPDDLRDAVAARIFRNPDLAVRALASEPFARVSEEGAALPSVAEILALAGDAARGRAVFASDRAGCAKCHVLGGEGGDVGPALTVIGSKYDRAALLDAILNPSAAVAFGFESWIVETVAGGLVTGFVLADCDPLILKDTSGEVRILAASEVVTRRRSKLSVMPDNVSAGLAAQELADLVELLASAR